MSLLFFPSLFLPTWELQKLFSEEGSVLQMTPTAMWVASVNTLLGGTTSAVDCTLQQGVRDPSGELDKPGVIFPERYLTLFTGHILIL